ncbi:MAG: hypothetical protein L6Q68_15615 [Aquabacterium sp.]|nr:hypothetical protein [Aquabacterium sp.]
MSAQTQNDRTLTWWRPFGALVVGLACTSAKAGFEDRAFDEQRVLAGDQMRQILHNYGACADVQDCRQKQLVFSSPAPGGFSIVVYHAIDSKAQRAAISACSDIFISNPRMRLLHLSVVAGAFEVGAWPGLFKRRRATVTIKFEREE